jgi:hypothetical protein
MSDDDQPEQMVRIACDPGRGDPGGALRRLRAAVPEARVEGPDERGRVVVRVAAASPDAATRRIEGVVAAGGPEDPLRVAGPVPEDG